MKKKAIKQELLKAIFERAYELESEFWENKDFYFGPGIPDPEKIQESALKKALKEWNDNKPVFSIKKVQR